MTTAELVNLILEKLRTGRVKFDCIWEDGPNVPLIVEFTYGFVAYQACWERGNGLTVRQRGKVDTFPFETNYSRWIEGVLNGKTRNEDGVLS